MCHVSLFDVICIYGETSWFNGSASISVRNAISLVIRDLTDANRDRLLPAKATDLTSNLFCYRFFESEGPLDFNDGVKIMTTSVKKLSGFECPLAWSSWWIVPEIIYKTIQRVFTFIYLYSMCTYNQVHVFFWQGEMAMAVSKFTPCRAIWDDGCRTIRWPQL